MKLKFCEWQINCTNAENVCTAHLAEGRAGECPYENLEQREKAEFPCSDYEKIKE